LKETRPKQLLQVHHPPNQVAEVLKKSNCSAIMEAMLIAGNLLTTLGT
jgi:hypothetical protein